MLTRQGCVGVRWHRRSDFDQAYTSSSTWRGLKGLPVAPTPKLLCSRDVSPAIRRAARSTITRRMGNVFDWLCSSRCSTRLIAAPTSPARTTDEQFCPVNSHGTFSLFVVSGRVRPCGVESSAQSRTVRKLGAQLLQRGPGQIRLTQCLQSVGREPSTAEAQLRGVTKYVRK